jgi:hypothetical protein
VHVIHLTPDGKSDVKVTYRQRVGAFFALLAILAGIGAALLFQRRIKVTSVLRRLAAELGRVKDTWTVAGLPALTLTDEVREVREGLRHGIDDVGGQHLVSLSETDPDVKKISDEIAFLRGLEFTWRKFATRAIELEKRTKEPVPRPAGWPDDIPERETLVRARLLLDEPIEIADVAARTTDITAHIDLMKRWTRMAAFIVGLYDHAVNFHHRPVAAVPAPPGAPAAPAAPDAGEGEGDKDPLDALFELYERLWRAGDAAVLDAIEKDLDASFGDIVKRPVRRVREAIIAASLNNPGWNGPTTARVLPAPEISVEDRLKALGDAGWGGSKRAVRAVWGFLRTCFWAVWHFIRRHAYGFGGVTAVALALTAVAWTGLKASWIDHSDFGWTGLVPAFLWGLVTATALDLLISAIERLRPGTRNYFRPPDGAAADGGE